MDNSFSSSMYLPYTLFETVKCFDDRNADDMQCGDMVEHDFLALGLKDFALKPFFTNFHSVERIGPDW